MKKQLLAIMLVIGLLVLYAAVQIRFAREYAALSQEAESALRTVSPSSVDDTKKLEETIALRIENTKRTLFWAILTSNISATLGVLAALVAAWGGFRQYMGTIDKQRHEQAARDLSELWKDLFSDDSKKRTAAVAGLHDFLAPDRQEFHRRVVSALALIGRSPDKDTMLHTTLAPVVEHALRALPPAVTTAVSWQGLRLPKADLANSLLPGIDFRDAFIEDADLSGADLHGARFHNARLNGTRFDNANLRGAIFEYADVAGCCFRGATLADANLNNVKLLDADLDQADLRGTESKRIAVDLTQAKNWRTARLAKQERHQLQEVHGKGPTWPRVLMLMWEIQPIVSGGGWTAAYHMIKNLCPQGANITLVVPWATEPISRSVFGSEVTLLHVGIEMSSASASAKQKNILYGYKEGECAYGYDGYGSSQYGFVNEFTDKAVRLAVNSGLQFDLIHAHDWLTFNAAMRLSEALHIPWLAHFHSTEADRRLDPASWIEAVEATACRKANRLLAPSAATRKRLLDLYSPTGSEILVVPNCLSRGTLAKGRVVALDPGLVVFVGRQSWQKAPDKFVLLARHIQALRPQTRFAMYGDEPRSAGFVYSSYSGNTKRTGLRDLVEKTCPCDYVRHVPPIGDEDIDKYLPRISNIRPAGMTPNHEVEAHDALAGDVATGAKRSLLRQGFSIQKYEGIGGFGFVAVLNSRGKGPASPWGYLLALDSPLEGEGDREEHIALKPFVPWERRHEAFRDAAILVLPSRYEPFGMVVLEAMQMGVPVFASHGAGVHEVVHTVRKCDTNDLFGTARQITGLLDDQSAWQDQVDRQLDEVSAYPDRGYERAVLNLWKEIAGSSPSVVG